MVGKKRGLNLLKLFLVSDGKSGRRKQKKERGKREILCVKGRGRHISTISFKIPQGNL